MGLGDGGLSVGLFVGAYVGGSARISYETESDTILKKEDAYFIVSKIHLVLTCRRLSWLFRRWISRTSTPFHTPARRMSIPTI